MEIHIGNLIKELVKSKQIDIGELSEKMNCSKRNIYKIYDKPSIDTSMLVKISKALGQNLFFSYISDEELAAYRNTKKKSAELMIALKELSATMTWLDEEKKMKERIKNKRMNAKK